MKIAVCTQKNHIELQEWPIPEIEPNKVLVKVSICGICGSDLAAWKGSEHKKYPYTPGHEFCGTIEKIGEEVPDLTIGQRVVIDPNLGCGECRYCKMRKPNLCDFLKTRPIKSNGGLAEYVALDYRMVHPLPDNLPDNLAPFIEPLSCAIHAANNAEVKPQEKVVIFGSGLVGLLTGLVLSSSKAEIVFVEPLEDRRKFVTEFLNVKAYYPDEAADSELKGKTDVAIDCSGNAYAVSQAIDLLRKAGRLVMAGIVISSKSVDIPFIKITTEELAIKGVWLNPYTFNDAMDITLKHISAINKLKTKTFKLNQIAEAFEQTLAPTVNKVLVSVS